MIPYSTFTLPNGLRVVHHYDAASPLVHVNLLYNVGARDENPAHTGMAHLFEHLMFGGSLNVPDFDGALELAGGSNNAWTSNDFTDFYESIPPVNLSTALRAEADRMEQLLLTDRSLEVQRKVVVEEFKQVCLNRPYGDFGHILRPLIYREHPYRIPTIGRCPEDIMECPAEEIRRFYHTHYSPSNAVLAIAGPVSLEEARGEVERWFGSVKPRPVAPRLYAPEPEITEARRLTVTRPVPQTSVTICFPMGAYMAPGYREADLITDVLASGISSRFYRRLVMGTDIFTSADASISGSDEPGYLKVGGWLRGNSDADVAHAEAALWEQLEKMATEGPSDYELESALNRFESRTLLSWVSCRSKALLLATAVMQNVDINTQIDYYRQATASGLRAEASRILRPERACTLIYRAE